MDKALVLADRLKKLKDQVDSLATKQTEIQTIKGDQGPKGEQGDRGFDGAPGLDGRDGKDGKDGAQGKDGVSVVKAEIAFDGSLVLYLSNGDQIDCGEVTPEKSKEVFQTIKNGGGSSPINIFTAVLPGLVPASGGGTTNFLRADGTFAAPPSGSPASPTTSVQFNNAGAFGGSANFTYVTGTNTFTVGPAGATTTIQTLAPTGATVAGTLRLLGRNASATNGNGGPITLTTGNGTGTGAGGLLRLITGTTSAGNGGRMSLVTGTGANAGGDIDIQPGNGGLTGIGGSFYADSGGAGPDSGGLFYMLGAGGGVGGSFSMTGGFSSNGTGGDIAFSSGGGTLGDGNLYLQDGYGQIFMRCKSVSSGGALQIGFFNATPVTKPAAVPVTAAGIHAALVSLGLIS